METARLNARGEDLKLVKNSLHLIRDFNPSLKGCKSTRGFNNNQTAALLFPASQYDDWVTNPQFQEDLRKGNEVVNPTDYPIFLYKDEFFSQFDVFDGFLQNEMLVKVTRMILTGPSSVDGHSGSQHATKQANAKLNEMKHMTIPCIAYISVLLYFALSSQPTFSSGGGAGKFDFNKFYRSIIDLLNNPLMEKKKTELLKWWDKLV
ncbi:hypothetical protein M422DRAFT_152168 [Sphaerobolus stellatus SS14]|nr:hypothetical protein M422DRAFT_152168 [Sphaerobolus stellatus SS14]